MTTVIKHFDQPLTFEITFEENLDATYELKSILFTPNISENSAGIILNLKKVSEPPSIFKFSFFQVFNGLDGENNILITISTGYADGRIVTHQESGTHIERPIL